MMGINRLNILGIEVCNLDYPSLIEKINASIKESNKIIIGYANAHTLNSGYLNKSLHNIYNSISLIHPDGIGVYLASKILYGKNCFKVRFTGSDFYPLLAERAIQEDWKIFFFGHDNITLNKIHFQYPSLNICGLEEGYNYKPAEVLKKINAAQPDVLVIGLGFPKQEKWLSDNHPGLNFKTAILTGDGIKVFAGIKKRGSSFIQKIGMEWFVRFLNDPARLFKRYIIGNPLFIYRVLKQRISS
jgi:N-acetylglucosaminyldiphosphoundecaprenol N-acetyl-beta-D-mannosaminyltransferase